MYLNKVILNNFRNIDHVEYDLKKTNIFHGPNARGKTNTILAIYWALTDYLMDGTSDYPSFKPHSDSSEVVSVELVFDTFSFKKTFAEKWVKTRGTTEVTMQGHETEYFIDDVKYGVTKGKELLLESLGIEKHKNVDIVRAILDPYFLAQQIPWKELRQFVIDLVGDVDDLSVLEAKKEYEPIKDDLVKQKFNATALTKLYRQNIKNQKDEIEKQENILLGYSNIHDVEQVELGKAEANLTLIDNDISALRAQKLNAVNPKVAQLESEMAEIRLKYSEALDADREHLMNVNKETNEKVARLRSDLLKSFEKLEALKATKRDYEKNLEEYEYNLKRLERERADLESRKEGLTKEWYEINGLEYKSLAVDACPHCGGVLNESELDEHQKAWEAQKQERLDANVAKGKKLKSELDNLNFKIAELKKPEAVDKDAEIEAFTADVAIINNKVKEAELTLINEYKSKEAEDLYLKAVEIKKRLDAEKAVVTHDDIDAKITKLIESKAIHQKVVDDHNAYLVVQKKSEETKALISSNQNALVEYETKQMLLEDFIKTKLTLLKDNVSKVFGDLEFVLVETNIKEGSYNEVCYPLILGKKTPFISGSGAEKIITGTYIIECVKNALGLPDLPIIFDEADKLDTATLSSKLETESQVISTKVDDINYDQVTLVSR